MNKLFARITIEKRKIGAQIRYLKSAVHFLKLNPALFRPFKRDTLHYDSLKGRFLKIYQILWVHATKY